MDPSNSKAHSALAITIAADATPKATACSNVAADSIAKAAIAATNSNAVLEGKRNAAANAREFNINIIHNDNTITNGEPALRRSIVIINNNNNRGRQ